MTMTKTIMIVDDNPDLVTLVRSVLEVHGYAVQCVYNGEDVFHSLRENRPDLILLDVVLPHMDGLAVLSRLKNDPESSSIPVILLTGRGQYKDVVEAYDRGTDYYISKPFTCSQLLNGINLLLENGNGAELRGK